MPVSLKATSRRANRVKKALFSIDSTLSDEAIQAAVTQTVGSPQRSRPRADDPECGCVSFGNPYRPSWTLSFTRGAPGERGYLVTQAEPLRGRIADAHEITFFLNALEAVLRRSDATARVSERRAGLRGRNGAQEHVVKDSSRQAH